MISVDNQAADHDERVRIDVFGKDDMHPADSAAAHVCDEKLLIVPEQESRQPVGRVGLRQVVAQLGCQLRDLASVRQASGSNRCRRHSRYSPRASPQPPDEFKPALVSVGSTPSRPARGYGLAALESA